MTARLETHTSGGRLVISFPEEALPAGEREAFVAHLKTEWMARQSRFSDGDALRLAEEADGTWWQQNKSRILANIAEAGA
jgi:hypothetical protein